MEKVGDANYPQSTKEQAQVLLHNLTGLQPNIIHYRAYGASGGKVVGRRKTFTTLTVIPPTVTTSAASNRRNSQH